MPLLVSRRQLAGLRVAACLSIAACSQAVFETYGCACASRTYTTEEVAGYRAAAARGELEGLDQMEEYYAWRADEHDEGTARYEQEKGRSEHYRSLRLAHGDPEVLYEEAFDLMYAAARERTGTPAQRLAALRKARGYIARIPDPPKLHWDLARGNRGEIDALSFVDREIALLEQSRKRS